MIKVKSVIWLCKRCGMEFPTEPLQCECKHKSFKKQITTEAGEAFSPDDYFEDKTFIPKRLGDFILKKIPMKTLKGNDRVYHYNNGYYHEDGKEKIKEMCAELLGDDYTKNRLAETISYIQAITYVSPNEIDNDWVNLENGLLNPITKEFIDNTPDVFNTIRIPIKYDPKADCPRFKDFLKNKINEQTINVIQEMYGYCYLPGQKFQKAFLLHGPGRTGKSTTLGILCAMLGEENVSAHSLQYLTENQFGVAYLYGAAANVCADISSRALRDTSTFMQITGADKISGAKKREHPISFFPSAKLIFSCNAIPSTSNKNLAFYRRWIILKFENQTLEMEVDEELPGKLKKELPGILNWALDGIERLNKQEKFSYWLAELEVKDLYERQSDSIQSFIFNNINSENDEGIIKKREVYKAYKKYCKDFDLPMENNIKFGRLFIALTGCGTGQQNKIPAYQGVSFKEENQRQAELGEYD